MIGRRALIAAGLSLPLAAVRSPWAQSPWKGYYATGTRQRAVRFAGGDGATLAGTLLLPLLSELQKVPGVVLVGGSGPTDRDGNNPLAPERIDLLKQIAELLADDGHRHAALRQARHRRLDGAAARHARGAGALLRLGQFRRRRRWPRTASWCSTTRSSPMPRRCWATARAGCWCWPPRRRSTRRAPHGMVLASTPGRPMIDIVRAQIARGAPNLLRRRRAHHDGDPGLGSRAGRPAGRAAGAVPALCRPVPATPAVRSIRRRRCSASTGPACCCRARPTAQVVPMEDVQPLIDALGQAQRARRGGGRPGGQPQSQARVLADRPGFAGPLAPAVAAKLVELAGAVLGA